MNKMLKTKLQNIHKVMSSHHIVQSSLYALFISCCLSPYHIQAQDKLQAELYFIDPSSQNTNDQFLAQIVNSPTPNEVENIDVTINNKLPTEVEEKFMLGQLSTDDGDIETPEFYDDIQVDVLGNQPIQEVIAAALIKSNRVRAALADLRVAQFGIDEAESGFYPTIGVAGNYGYTRSDSNVRREGMARNTTIAVQQNFDVFGRLSSQTDRAQFIYNAQQHTLDLTRSEVALETARAYADTIRDYLFMEARREHVKIVERNISDQKKRIATGLGNRLELSKLAIELSTVKTELHRAEGRLATTRGRLEELSGIVNTAPSLESLLFFINTQPIDRGDLNAIISEHHPSVKEAAARAKAAKANVVFVESDLYPTLGLNVNAQNNEFKKENSEGYGAQLNFDVPIYDGGGRLARLKSAQEAFASAQENIIQTQSEVYLRALSDYNVSQALHQSYLSLLVSEKEALQYVDDAKRLLNDDIGTIEQVITAQKSYIDTKIAIVNIQFEQINAHLSLLHNVGILLKLDNNLPIDQLGDDIAAKDDSKS